MKTSRRIIIIAFSCLTGGIPSAGFGRAVPRKAAPPPSKAIYQIDTQRSRFIVETETTGVNARFAHRHQIGVRDFTGQARFARDSAKGASLTLTVQAKSLYLLGEDNTIQREAIEYALRDAVLETGAYPQVVFKSGSVTSERRSDGTFDVRITGNLKLHGVRRQITIPARISLDGGTLHAIGVIELRQTNFKITPYSFLSLGVGIRDVVTLSFDIVATQPQS